MPSSSQHAEPNQQLVKPVDDKHRYDDMFTLTVYEVAWRDRQVFLASKGYMLRPRYHPDWVPSWKGTGKQPISYEDSITSPLRQHLMDATRVSDGELVYIKRVKTGDQESQIALLLSSEDRRNDPRNHCIPILDHFQDDGDSLISYIVMPFLRPIDNPPLRLVDDVVSFCDQLLEGLAFMHEKGVAHRDCSYRNLMMDAKTVYPRGFHPVSDQNLPDGLTEAKHLPRYAGDVKYYYVDFGISVVIPPETQPKLATGNLGRDREPPELESEDKPYDPFKLDVFIVGNVFRRHFYDFFSNVGFLQPLIASMIQSDPALRPDAAGALEQWRAIRKRLWTIQRGWGLKDRDTVGFSALLENTGSFFRLFAIPPRKALARFGQSRRIAKARTPSASQSPAP